LPRSKRPRQAQWKGKRLAGYHRRSIVPTLLSHMDVVVGFIEGSARFPFS